MQIVALAEVAYDKSPGVAAPDFVKEIEVARSRVAPTEIEVAVFETMVGVSRAMVTSAV